jgi:hypothetical protein
MSEHLKNPELHQELDEVPKTTILLVFGGMALILALLITWAWYGLEQRERILRPSLNFPEQRLGPRHAVDDDLEDIFGNQGRGEVLNDRKRREIAKFHWVDKGRGVVDIPIEDAIELLVATRGP